MSQGKQARQVTALDAPTMTVPASGLVVGAEGVVTFPSPAFLIEHDAALILFDTGFAPEAFDDPAAYFGPRLDRLSWTGRPEHRLDLQLRALGHDVHDVTHVVISHGHSDHAGAVRQLPRAELWAGPGELAWSESPDEGSRRYFNWELELAPIGRERWRTVPSPAFDLLGDGSVTVLHTPGHTPGELSLRVLLPNGPLVLTADTVHLRSGLDLLAPYPHDWDVRLAVESIAALRAMEAAGDRLWIAHDPDDWAAHGPLTPVR